MLSSPRLLHRVSLGRWLLGLVLVMANGSGWADADSVAGAGERIGRLAERAAVAPVAAVVAHDVVYQGAVLRGLYGPGTAPVDHPCGHTNATAGVAPSRDPCTSPGSPCAGLCTTACQPAAGAGPALPFTPAGLPATGLAEARPQRSGWTGTGRSVPPESPPPIV